ncbi:MAG: PLP-dependent aminotransferase family protein, partial [Kiloniellaceae bacterium]
MPEARRRDLAEIARRHGVPIVEDDIMRLLREEAPPPIATFAPELTYYITSLSKTVAPGLRIGFVATPPGATGRVSDAVRATCWMAPPLTVEVGARWIETGAAERLLADRRRESASRRARMLERLGPRPRGCPPGRREMWGRR